MTSTGESTVLRTTYPTVFLCIVTATSTVGDLTFRDTSLAGLRTYLVPVKDSDMDMTRFQLNQIYTSRPIMKFGAKFLRGD